MSVVPIHPRCPAARSPSVRGPGCTRPRGRVALALILATGCATGSASFAMLPTRPAVDTPAAWATEDEATEGSRPTCRSPLVDPRNGALLALERSGVVQSSTGARFDPAQGADHGGRLVGDYRAPAGRYDVGPAELLRVDCTTRRTIGIVPR